MHRPRSAYLLRTTTADVFLNIVQCLSILPTNSFTYKKVPDNRSLFPVADSYLVEMLKDSQHDNENCYAAQHEWYVVYKRVCVTQNVI